MNNIIYIQCDARYNKCLLMKVIQGMALIDIVISKVQKISVDRIVINLYHCEENKELYSYVNKHYEDIEITWSATENINDRLLEFVKTLLEITDSYIVRIAGDAILIDEKWTGIILQEMKMGYDCYYDEENDGSLPDIVSCETLLKYEKEVKAENRYYQALRKIDSIRMLEKPYVGQLLPVNIAFNNIEIIELFATSLEVKKNIFFALRDVLQKIFNNDSYLLKNHWFSSLLAVKRNELIDFINPTPWFTYGAIDFIKNRINKNMQIFEWGTGNSTLFWESRVKNVVGVEHNLDWFYKISELVSDNVEIRYIELDYGERYSSSILAMSFS